MKLELRKVRYIASLSEETNCFTADLFVDGVLTAHISNRGHGGCDEQRPAKGKTEADIVAVENWIKKNHAPIATDMLLDGKPFVMTPNLETICTDLMAANLATKQLERLLKRTVAYIDPKTKMIYSFTGKVEGVQRAHAITETARRKPDAIILNNLPFDEALKAFRAASQ